MTQTITLGFTPWGVLLALKANLILSMEQFEFKTSNSIRSKFQVLNSLKYCIFMDHEFGWRIHCTEHHFLWNFHWCLEWVESTLCRGDYIHILELQIEIFIVSSKVDKMYMNFSLHWKLLGKTSNFTFPLRIIDVLIDALTLQAWAMLAINTISSERFAFSHLWMNLLFWFAIKCYWWILYQISIRFSLW